MLFLNKFKRFSNLVSSWNGALWILGFNPGWFGNPFNVLFYNFVSRYSSFLSVFSGEFFPFEMHEEGIEDTAPHNEDIQGE